MIQTALKNAVHDNVNFLVFHSQSLAVSTLLYSSHIQLIFRTMNLAQTCVQTKHQHWLKTEAKQRLCKPWSISLIKIHCHPLTHKPGELSPFCSAFLV
jgi:hypothetical protein